MSESALTADGPSATATTKGMGLVAVCLLSALATVPLSHLAMPFDAQLRRMAFVSIWDSNLEADAEPMSWIENHEAAVTTPSEISKRHFLGAIIASTLMIWVCSYLVLRRRIIDDSLEGGRNCASLVLSCAIIWMAMFLAIPWSSADIYLYLAQASTWVDFNQNPYSVAPASVPQNPFLQLMTWPNQPAQYGPVGMIVSAAIYRPGLGPWGNLVCARIVGIACIAGCLWLARTIARETGRQTNHADWLLVAASPLLIIEVAVAAHNDSWIALLILGSLLAFLRGRFGFGLVLFVASVWIKYTTVIFAPAIAVYLWRFPPSVSARWIGLSLGILCSAAGSIGLCWLFGGYENVLAGARAATPRAGNSLVWQVAVIVEQLSEKSMWPIHVSRAIAVGAALACAIRIRRRSDLPTAVITTYLAFLLFGAVWFQPWYLVPLLVLEPLANNPQTRRIITVFATTSVLGLYGLFFCTYSDASLVQVATGAIIFYPVIFLAVRHFRPIFLSAPSGT
jgi:hypothetical protein